MTSRALVVSNRWVPSATGTPIVLYELFRHFQPGSVTVICGPGLRPPSTLSLPFRTVRLSAKPIDRVLSRAYHLGGRAMLPLVRSAISTLVRLERPHTIYAHFPDAVFVTAAAQVAEKFGIPLVTYFDILWGGYHDPGMSGRYENYVCRVAKRRFAITETFCEDLQRRHGVDFELLPHVIVTPAERPTAVSPSERRNVVHFGGAVYETMNLDSMQRLHGEMKDLGVGLEIFGFTPKADLARWGLDGAFVTTGALPREQLLVQQRTAKVLYLPEAFESTEPEMIRHNFPTKALEYMLTGTPILVHAPAESYLARSAREHGWGVLVDQKSGPALREGLRKVLEGGPEIELTLERAWHFAKSRDGRTWSRRLQEALNVAPTN